MSAWLVSLAGTAQGAHLATALALMSAIAHAFFGALQKGRHDPWATRGAIDLWVFALSAPVALVLVPWPEGRQWLLLAGALVLHFAYKLTMALAYSRAAYTVVYPVVRGTGPLVTVAAAVLVFHEHFNPAQWGGVALLSAAILGLAALNLGSAPLDPRLLRAGLGWAFAAGLLVAAYTTFDAFAIRATPDPFTFLTWFFLVTAVDFPMLMARQWARTGFVVSVPLLTRGLIGALTAFFSFGGVMLATRIGAVGQAAVLRETSTLFAALIGWIMLGERTWGVKLLLMGLIAAGAVIVQTAG